MAPRGGTGLTSPFPIDDRMLMRSFIDSHCCCEFTGAAASMDRFTALLLTLQLLHAFCLLAGDGP